MTDIPILFSAPMVLANNGGTKTMTRRMAWSKRKDPADDILTIDVATPWQKVKPGDRLWVKETWAQNWNQLSETRMDRSVVYRADSEDRALDNGIEMPWKPSIYMPRYRSRTTLIVTDVWIERLHNISTSSVIKESIPEQYTCGILDAVAMQSQFKSLWNSIHGPGAWDANDEVVAISYTVHQCNIDQMERAA